MQLPEAVHYAAHLEAGVVHGFGLYFLYCLIAIFYAVCASCAYPEVQFRSIDDAGAAARPFRCRAMCIKPPK